MKQLMKLTPPPRKLTALAALLAAVLMAAPVWAQQTGMITSFPPNSGGDFKITKTATINGNREWEVDYTVNLDAAIKQNLFNCGNESPSIPPDQCSPSPYTLRYGEIPSQTACLFSQPPQAAIRGVNATIPLTSWQQTVRARPGRQYCIAVYSSGSGTEFHNKPIAAVWFRTPADPNPPDPPAWMPHPSNTGCGTETTLALVRQCFQCKGGGGSWSMSANTCGN